MTEGNAVTEGNALTGVLTTGLDRLFIRSVSTVVIVVAPPDLWDAPAIGALEVVGLTSAHRCKHTQVEQL